MIVPYVLNSSSVEFSELALRWSSQLTENERILCIPKKLSMWKEWFGKQMSIAGLKDVGVYLV